MLEARGLAASRPSVYAIALAYHMVEGYELEYAQVNASSDREAERSEICNFFFGGLVLGCIKTKFCKKICV